MKPEVLREAFMKMFPHFPLLAEKYAIKPIDSIGPDDTGALRVVTITERLYRPGVLLCEVVLKLEDRPLPFLQAKMRLAVAGEDPGAWVDVAERVTEKLAQSTFGRTPEEVAKGLLIGLCAHWLPTATWRRSSDNKYKHELSLDGKWVASVWNVGFGVTPWGSTVGNSYRTLAEAKAETEENARFWLSNSLQEQMASL